MTKTHPRSRKLAAAVLGSVVLAACGGGTGSISGSAVTGVAITDAPVAGAAVTVADSSSTVQQRTVTTRADGSFSVDVSGLTPPYAVRVVSGAGKLYAMTEGAENLDVTPITGLAYSYAAGADGEDALFLGTAGDKRAVAVQARAFLTDLAAELAPLLNQYGIANLRTDSAAIRALLEDVSVSNSGGVVTFRNRITGGTIHSGQLTAPTSGSFDPSQIPTTCGRGGRFDPSHAGSMGPPPGSSGGTSPGAPSGSATSSGSTSTGASLYASKCASCHGALGSSTVQGTTAAKIVAKHANLVTTTEAASIATALSSGSTTSSGGTTPPGMSSGGTAGSSGGMTPPGMSSGGTSGGGTTNTNNLPPGHPTISAGRSCTSCHGGGSAGRGSGRAGGSSGGTAGSSGGMMPPPGMSSGGSTGSSGGMMPPPGMSSGGSTASSGGMMPPPGMSSGGSTGSSGGMTPPSTSGGASSSGASSTGNLPANHPATNGQACSACH